MKHVGGIIVALCLLLSGCSKADQTAGQKSVEPLPQTPIPLEAEDLGSAVKVVDIPMEWGASKAKGATARMLWVRPTLKNDGKIPIGVVYGTIRITDEDERILEEADEIFYFQPDEGQPLMPGKTSKKDPYRDGDPFILMRDGMIVEDIPVTVQITITSAYQSSDVHRGG